MKKNFFKKSVSFMVIGLAAVGLLTTGKLVYAADTTAPQAVDASAYTVSEMLQAAITDEYLAQAQYTAILNEYGQIRPFSNIVRAEATHIDLLLPLLTEYEVEVPSKDWSSLVSVPDTLSDSYQAGILAEEKNIAMYEGFLKENLPDDVKDTFERLLNASAHHQNAFENASDGTCTYQGNTRSGNNGRGYGCGSGSGMNRGNRGNQGSCYLTD